MKLSRRLRGIAAVFALLGVLFSQLAIAAYACPLPDGPAAQAMGAPEGGMPCCDEASPAPDGALCSAHCQQGDQSLDKPAPPAPGALPSAVGLRIAVFDAAAPPAGPPGALPSLLTRATAPPLAVRHCRFHI